MASSMTSTPYAAAQATAAAGAQRGARKPFGVRYDAAKGLSAMLLAAMVSALVVVADQLIDTWADGHLLAAWVALWAVGFGALAIFGGAARKLAIAAVDALDAWSRRVAQTRADERLWAIAQTDPRVMADLQMVLQRDEEEASSTAGQGSVSRPAQRLGAAAPSAKRLVPNSYKYLPYI